MSRKKEIFKPIKKGRVGLYSCGPTVYSYAHIGHFRSYIFVDTLKRILRYNRFKVKHVMNITDVGHLTSDADTGEDKIEKGAKRENIKVAGQSFNEFPIEISAQKSQLLKICQNEKIEPLNLSEGNFLEREGLKIAQKALEADLIINLPRLKIGEARASQNLFKLLDKTNYLAQEYLSGEKEIFEKLKKQLPPVLTVAQADSVQKQDGRMVHIRLTMACLNPLYLDRIFAQITASPLPKILKNVNTEDIRILGRKIEELEWIF